MTKTFSWEAFNKAPIVSIFRNLNSDDLLNVAQCFQESGLSTMEITLNSKNATDDIERLVKEYGSILNIGAGTVCSMEDLHLALNAGAQFIVTPILDKEVIQYCVKETIPIFPGAFTANIHGLEAGCQYGKSISFRSFRARVHKRCIGPFR